MTGSEALTMCVKLTAIWEKLTQAATWPTCSTWMRQEGSWAAHSRRARQVRGAQVREMDWSNQAQYGQLGGCGLG